MKPSTPLMEPPPQKPNLWQVFRDFASPEQKKIIVLINLIFTMCTSVVIGLSILYKEPIILCSASLTSPFTICSEDKACHSPFYQIDLINSPQSLSTEFSLICSDSAKKRLALTCCFCGMLIGCIFSTFVMIPKKRRLLVICFHGFLFSFALITMLFCTNFYLIGGFTGVAAFCYLLLNNNAYLYARENFSGELAGFTTISFNVCWALMGMSFAIMNYFTNANWKIFLLVSGVISFISSIVLTLIALKSPKAVESSMKRPDEEVDDVFEVEEKEKGFCGNLNEIREHRQIKTNYFFYMLAFAYYSVSYYCIYVEMDSIGGDLYLKILVCCGLELFAAVFTGVIIEYFDTEKILKANLTFLAIFFMIFLFCPKDIAQGGGLQVLFFTFCLFFVKVNDDMLNIAIYLNVPKAVTEKYFAFWLLSSRFLSRFLNMVMPHFNYMVRSFGIHPFFIYGVFWMGFRLTLRWTASVESEGVEEILRETKCALSERMSLICQSRSFASLSHDDMLKNIMYKGSPLSMFMKRNQEKDRSLLVNNDSRNKRHSHKASI